VTSKVVSLFDAFQQGDVELSLNELARRTGCRCPPRTGWPGAGAVGRPGTRRGGGYRIGLRLLEVGARAPRAAGLNELVVPFMQDLFVATRQNVHLAVLEGHEALYVERVTGLQSIAVKSRRWGRLPLHATGVGKVLLAYAPNDLVDAVIAAGLPRFTPYTIVAPGHLRRNLAEIRRTGVGIANEENDRRAGVGGRALDGRGRSGGGRHVDRRAHHGRLPAPRARRADRGAGRVPAPPGAGLSGRITRPGDRLWLSCFRDVTSLPLSGNVDFRRAPTHGTVGFATHDLLGRRYGG
jgi:DNA-binding IclR family transcriptional regulator